MFRVKGLDTLIVVRELEHGRILSKMMGVPFVCGEDPSCVRNEILRQFPKYGCVIASTIFEEGIDVPSISALVVACGGKSSIKTIQRVGRGMRPGKDKKLYVVDFYDDFNRYLRRHSEKRIQLYEEHGYDVKFAKL